MVRFEEVDPQDMLEFRQSRRGRVSYPILKSFLETNLYLAKLDRTGMQQSLQALTSTLIAYIKSHGMPIKMFTRGGQIYLMRLDVTPEGEPIPNWRSSEIDDTPPVPITPEVVVKRFEEDKDAVTK